MKLVITDLWRREELNCSRRLRQTRGSLHLVAQLRWVLLGLENSDSSPGLQDGKMKQLSLD